MRRPFYFINSSMFIEDGNGQVIGEVQQRWHLWRRNYDLYIGAWWWWGGGGGRGGGEPRGLG